MAKPGDKVKVVTKKETYEGILMPSPEVLKTNSIVLKLDNGYNIGINKKKIQKISVIKAAKRRKKTFKKIPRKRNLPDIAILSTGGTISSKVNYETGGTFPALSASDLIESVPKLKRYGNYDFKQISQIWSEDINPDEWVKLAKEIYKQIKNGKKGIIVTQGTDTLHFSSAAISFMLQNLPIPVVFVASQRSVDRGSSDAFPNLLTAAVAASKWDGAEVVICMHESMEDVTNILIRGTKARKMHTERRDAFRPINDLPLVRIDYKGNIIRSSSYKKRSDSKPVLNTKLDKKVALIWIYPGIDPKIMDYYIQKKYHGIVIAGTGFGNVPENFINSLKKCYKAKIPVVMTSQCLYGRTNPRVYERGRKILLEGKVIYGSDMTPETAYVKLIHVLGQTKQYDKVKEMMQKNLSGEITERITPNSFLV